MPERAFSPLEEAVVDGYVGHTAWVGGPRSWTADVLDDLIQDAPDRAWPLLVEIVRRTPDRELGGLGAGPIEDLLARHGHRVVAAVEAQAAADPRFRSALANVWQNRMPDEVFAQVRAAAGMAAARPDRERLEAEEPAWARRRLELRIDGRPPGASMDPAVEAEAIDRLRSAVQGRPPEIVLPFIEPMSLEVHVQLVPGSAAIEATKVLDALVHALALPEVGACLDPMLIRDVMYHKIASRKGGYVVTLGMMWKGQVAALEDPRDVDEILLEPGADEEYGLAAEDLRALREHRERIDQVEY